MLTAISVIFAFSILVVFHEFGHFIVAKLFKVKVEKFAIGFGKEVIGFSGKETRYSLNFFPLGGFVKMLGDEPGDEKAKDSRSYLAQKWYKRIGIVLSGPLMSFVLAIVLFIVIFMVGVQVPDISSSKIGFVYEDTPAQKAGLKTGDTVVSVDGKKIHTWDDLTKMIQPSAGKKLTIIVQRGDKEVSVEIVPKLDEEREIGVLGIRSESKVERLGIFKAANKAVSETGMWTVITLKSLWWMVTGKISAEVSGPVGIVQMIGMGAKAGFNSLVAFIAVLSINLGIFNLFPIPILDGGHILFLLLEGVRGKPVSTQKLKIAQAIGLALLLSIFLFATYKDIIRLLLPPTR